METLQAISSGCRESCKAPVSRSVSEPPRRIETVSHGVHYRIDVLASGRHPRPDLMRKLLCQSADKRIATAALDGLRHTTSDCLKSSSAASLDSSAFRVSGAPAFLTTADAPRAPG